MLIRNLMFLGLPDPHLRPDPLDRGTDPMIRIRFRIRTKISRIHITGIFKSVLIDRKDF